jgi:hypothetical protein
MEVNILIPIRGKFSTYLSHREIRRSNDVPFVRSVEMRMYNWASTCNSIIDFHHIICSIRCNFGVIFAIGSCQADLHLRNCQAIVRQKDEDVTVSRYTSDRRN